MILVEEVGDLSKKTIVSWNEQARETAEDIRLKEDGTWPRQVVFGMGSRRSC